MNGKNVKDVELSVIAAENVKNWIGTKEYIEIYVICLSVICNLFRKLFATAKHILSIITNISAERK